MKSTFKLIGITIITLAAMSTTACNTIQGAGQDIESAGEALEDAVS